MESLPGKTKNLKSQASLIKLVLSIFCTFYGFQFEFRNVCEAKISINALPWSYNMYHATLKKYSVKNQSIGAAKGIAKSVLIERSS